jgi:hypothetical protein
MELAASRFGEAPIILLKSIHLMQDKNTTSGRVSFKNCQRQTIQCLLFCNALVVAF